MNIRTRGRWLAARLRKLERASAVKPQTAGQISNDVDGIVVASRPGQPDETMCQETEEGCLPEVISGAVPIRSE